MDSKGRALVFWGVCIPLRWWLSNRGDQLWLRAFAAVIGSRWIAGLENGNEGVFGGPTWWAEQRFAHGVLWNAYALTGSSSFLRVDTAFGAANWIRSQM